MRVQKKRGNIDVETSVYEVSILASDLEHSRGYNGISIPIHPPDYMKEYTILTAQIVAESGVSEEYGVQAWPQKKNVFIELVPQTPGMPVHTDFRLLLVVSEYFGSLEL